MLPETPLLLAFIGASLVLALTPGPAVVYIVARTLSQGRGCGLASVLGVALRNFGNAVGAAVGLRHALWGNRLAGSSFIGMGVLTAMGSRPTR